MQFIIAHPIFPVVDIFPVALRVPVDIPVDVICNGVPLSALLMLLQNLRLNLNYYKNQNI